ncbi:MAG: hypothetical protein AAF921_18200 [Cyanobacteria bacterium P01_D01_bin.44]
MNSLSQLEISCKLLTSLDDSACYLKLVFEIFVDDQCFCDFTYYAVDLNALVQSIHQNGQFYIITCGCGIPGCIGIVRGIQVLHDQGSVSWLVTQPRPSRTLIFERKMYEDAIYAAVNQGQELITQAKHRNQTLFVVPRQNAKLLGCV